MGLAFAPVALAAQTTTGTTPPTDTTARRTAATPAVAPTADPARGVDAEVRVALFDLLNGQSVPAVSRLQFLQSSPTALNGAAAGSALRGRQEVLFLLAQGYYRLGADAGFRSTADALLADNSSARYAPILRTQLLLEAYRGGDYARATQMAQSLAGTPSQGLAALVAGLAAYQTGNFAGARTQFAAAQQGNGQYAGYARYMDALAQLRADTAQTGPALTALQQVASGAQGEFADQVRLTAAQLAYEGEQYAQAATLAGAIAPTSGLGAQALFTRAWALYKSNQIGPAGEAFAQFAQAFPQLPERDEARLMSAQASLQLGRTDEAAQVFRMVADSAASEAAAMQGRTAATMAEAARALVTARAAGLLFVNDPANGKTIALQETAGADRSALAMTVSDTVTAQPEVGAPEIVSLTDVAQRYQSLGAAASAVPQRVLYTQTSATNTRADYGTRSRALYQADVQVALASYRLQEQLASQARQLALLQSLQRMLTEDGTRLAAISAQLAAAQDSLTRVQASLEASAARIRQLFRQQAAETRSLADQNVALLDTVRTQLAPSSNAQDAQVLATEAQTAATYRGLADLIENGIETAISHHPTFALRDSVRTHAARTQQLVTETQGALATARGAVDAELTRLQAGDSPAIVGLRSTLASAEQQRSAMETQLIDVVQRELAARAGEMVADLRHDTEAAQFGVASASFFKSLGDSAASRAAAPTTGTTGGATGMNSATSPATSSVANASAPATPAGTAPAGAPAPGTPNSTPRK